MEDDGKKIVEANEVNKHVSINSNIEHSKGSDDKEGDWDIENNWMKWYKKKEKQNKNVKIPTWEKRQQKKNE